VEEVDGIHRMKQLSLVLREMEYLSSKSVKRISRIPRN
jgi:hypothetical protein